MTVKEEPPRSPPTLVRPSYVILLVLLPALGVGIYYLAKRVQEVNDKKDTSGTQEETGQESTDGNVEVAQSGLFEGLVIALAAILSLACLALVVFIYSRRRSPVRKSALTAKELVDLARNESILPLRKAKMRIRRYDRKPKEDLKKGDAIDKLLEKRNSELYEIFESREVSI